MKLSVLETTSTPYETASQSSSCSGGGSCSKCGGGHCGSCGGGKCA